MKRLFTSVCLAATFAAGLAAQSTSTGTATNQDPATTGQRGGGGPRTVTGCLRAGDTAGSYVLADVIMPGGGGRRGGDTASTGAATSTGGGSTTGATTTGTGTSAGAQAGRGPGGPQTIMLNAASDVDLKPHVGHKIEVTGTMAGGGGRGRGGDATATGTATGTTSGAGTATGTGTATGSSGTASTGGGQGGGRGRSMTVTAIKMVSDSCS